MQCNTSGTRRRLPACLRGQNMVEFALIAPIFFMILFGCFELGRLAYINHSLENATREGARFAMVRGSKSTTPATQTQIIDLVRDRATGVDGTITVTASGLGGNPDNGDTVTVTSSYDFHFIVGGLLGLSDKTLQHSSTVPILH
jgi:Flp pilus assembly protein TadG